MSVEAARCGDKDTMTKHRQAPMTREEFIAARQALGLTQAELAYELGLTVGAVSRKEQGSRPIEKRDAIVIRCLLAEREQEQ